MNPYVDSANQRTNAQITKIPITSYMTRMMKRVGSCTLILVRFLEWLKSGDIRHIKVRDMVAPYNEVCYFVVVTGPSVASGTFDKSVEKVLIDCSA
jgi:hypothetical protein